MYFYSLDEFQQLYLKFDKQSILMLNRNTKNAFNILFNAIPQSAIIIDKNQSIKALNLDAEKTFGHTEENIINKPIDTLILNKYSHEDFILLFQEKERRKLGVEKYLFGLHKTGNSFPIEVVFKPFLIDDQEYLIALVEDISIQKYQKLEIAKLNLQLENNVQKRTQNLSDSIIKLEKINRKLDRDNQKNKQTEKKVTDALNKERELNGLRTKLLSMVSHEFKTPLTGISISSMLIEKYKLTEHQEKRKKHLSTINSKVHYLNNILNNFLSIEKFEKGLLKYNITTFNIKDTVLESISGAKILLKSDQEIICDSNLDHITLHQDQKILELTLSNLLSNAIKYSEKKRKIFIDIKQDKEFTILQVKDQGCGIPEAEQKNIFKRYYRAENVLLIEGTGIGLNIIQSHLKNLGGSIVLKSKLHIGTTATVTIPNTINL